ncbi:MAG TPA: MucB/RseB C-terminal domain-containing protein [Hydrogenophaga sp.]|uniref:MucB/RseB C-terminal domain-containing protein n=1 Tax=Hydrogenophaga sp. TaxID=1904254 RepID=UPI002BB04DEB|nr:MucB/RseB C-terminal domain-containing protein [Hydrogenophaga sp.]HMN94303.1 MucB/RseB C-terminal domain-containing protein [Hydrogenophaga sp.]
MMPADLASLVPSGRPGLTAVHALFSRRFWRSLVLPLLAGAVGALAQAQTPAAALPAEAQKRSLTEWLTRIHDASRQRAYVGTFVVSAGGEMSTSRIWHVCDGQQQMERIDTLTGEPRITLRRNSDVITFAPESKRAWVDNRESLGLFPELLRTPRNLIPEFYSHRETGVDRVAGHKTHVLEILPRDALRFGYRIWSEQGTGLVVKLQTLDAKGQVLEQLAFSDLELDAPVSMGKLSQLMRNTRGYEVYRPRLRKTTAEAEGWRLSEPVPGFQSMSCHVKEAEAGSDAPMHWVFSDGLASVSLFVQAHDPVRHTRENSMVSGATHSISRKLGDHWVTVMGEVPTPTLEQFVRVLERIRR